CDGLIGPWHRLLGHLAASLRDEPGAALIARMNPQPTQCHAEPVPQADQKIDVGDTPYPPGNGAAQLDAAEIDDRAPLADLRQAAGVYVAEWRRRRVATQARLDD